MDRKPLTLVTPLLIGALLIPGCVMRPQCDEMRMTWTEEGLAERLFEKDPPGLHLRHRESALRASSFPEWRSLLFVNRFHQSEDVLLEVRDNGVLLVEFPAHLDIERVRRLVREFATEARARDPDQHAEALHVHTPRAASEYSYASVNLSREHDFAQIMTTGRSDGFMGGYHRDRGDGWAYRTEEGTVNLPISHEDLGTITLSAWGPRISAHADARKTHANERSLRDAVILTLETYDLPTQGAQDAEVEGYGDGPAPCSLLGW